MLVSIAAVYVYMQCSASVFVAIVAQFVIDFVYTKVSCGGKVMID